MEIDYIPAIVLADQYEMDLYDQGILPDEPFEELPEGAYPRVKYMAEKGDKIAIVIEKALNMDLSQGVPEGYEDAESFLMS